MLAYRMTKDKNKQHDLKEQVIQDMVSMGQQVPLSALMKRSDIMNLKVLEHSVLRFKKRERIQPDIQIENNIKSALCHPSSKIVALGHSGRYKVFSDGFIFVIDKNYVYTEYDANERDRNNILDDTHSKLKRAEKNTRAVSRIDELFKQIQMAK